MNILLICLALLTITSTQALASEYKLIPSIGIGGVTEVGDSFDVFYKFRLDATTPKLIGPLAFEAGAAVTSYQMPYYFTPGGQKTVERKKQLVDEWKFDYQAAGVYSLLHDEVIYQFLGGASGLYLHNDKVNFSAAGPMLGFRAYTDNDWGRALVNLDVTPYLVSQSHYTLNTVGDTFVYQGSATNTSIYGKPVVSIGYKVAFTIPYDAGYKLEYMLDGQMIKFDTSYRYYNGIAIALRF